MKNAQTAAIIEKWYKKIGFPSHYDKEFYDALNSMDIDTSIKVEQYDLENDNGKENFLYFLYFCEELERKYKERGISDEILYDTLADMPRWLDTWSGLKGGLYFGELDWFYVHFTMRLFKIGRLQYCMSKSSRELDEHGVCKGDNVVDIHIPAAGPLLREECEKSVDMAREFFKNHYPEFEFNYFMCGSWLLDESLDRVLKPESNILQFQKLFKMVGRKTSDSMFGYVFRWKIKREELKDIEPKNNFAKRVKELALAGEPFYAGVGLIKK